MYELTFSVENANENLLKYMYKRLELSVNKVGGIGTYLHEQHRSRFALACNDLFASAIREESKSYLLDVLALGFKNKYIRDRLQIQNNNLFFNTLVNTMCIFDNQFDKNIIKKRIEIEGEICIDGYYNFRMRDLKEKWDELVSVVNNNNALLKDNFLIKDNLYE